MPFWSNVDHLPAMVRDKVREKPKRSAKEYEKSRLKVHENVREAKKLRKQNENLAEVMLYVEVNEEELKEKMKEENLQDVSSEIRSYDARQWSQLQQAFAEGHFDISVDKDDANQPQISMTIDQPEGNVAEKMQLNQSLQDALITRALGKKEE